MQNSQSYPSNEQELKSTYAPRPHFIPFHQRPHRFGVMVAHRRAGKTVACINELIHRALYSKKKRARYAYIGPQLKQAKKIAWEYLKEYTEGMQLKKPSETELTVILRHNKAEVTIYGADNPDSFRGQYFDGVILDEYGDMHPSIWGKILLPTLADRRGWAVFIGTPKGKNHFYKIFMEAGQKGNWFRFLLKASESGILPPEELVLQASEQTEDEYAQEYECSFDAAVVGTYYAKLLSKLEADKRIIAECEYDPEFPVEVASDLGYTDSSAYWFWQNKPDGFAIIDYYEAHSEALAHYFSMLRDKGYRYGTIWLPHDAMAKSLQTGRSTIEQFLEAELPRFSEDSSMLVRIVPNLALQDGIDAVRKVLPMCWFNPRCYDGIEALRAYRRAFDEEKKVYSDKPLHDWASHPADGFRYLSLIAKQRIVPVSEVKKLYVPPAPPKYTLEDLFQDREGRLRLNRGRI